MAGEEYESYYAVVRAIPSGRVMTYGDVAARAGRRGQARRVGYALAALRDSTVPWWRVVNARGEISARAGETGPSGRQRRLLADEGVAFDSAGRIDLDRFRHRPPRDPAGPMLPFEEIFNG